MRSALTGSRNLINVKFLMGGGGGGWVLVAQPAPFFQCLGGQKSPHTTPGGSYSHVPSFPVKCSGANHSLFFLAGKLTN